MLRVITNPGWAVFCRVVDNHGDLGVCWRLATQLAAKGKTVALYVDDASALAWMAPLGCSGVSVHPWPAEDLMFDPQQIPQVVIEAFGCELPLGYQAAMAARATPPVWINLEYFSAEAVAQRNHGLPSPVMSGPANGLLKWFFYPGLSEESGGVLGAGSSFFANDASAPASTIASPLRISLFCYEPASLSLWLQQLKELPQGVCLSVTAGRATQAVRLALGKQQHQQANFKVQELPYLSHPGFDDMLTQNDLNLVRGEDSLVRAIWAGKAFLWHIYPQDDGAHIPKLHAFLQATHAPPLVVQAHLAWNADTPTPLPALTPETIQTWTTWAQDLRQRLSGQTDLLMRLESFVAAHG